MHRNNGKKYIKKEKKWNVIITLLTIVIVMVVIAVIELLPSRVPELGYSDMNGVGRTFLYPFVREEQSVPHAGRPVCYRDRRQCVGSAP